MNSIFKMYLLRFIILFSLVIPYSLTIISTDIFFKQEVSYNQIEIKSTVYKSSDSLFFENSDDVDETSLLTLFFFAFFSHEELISRFNNQTFFLLFKIPFQLQKVKKELIQLIHVKDS